MRLSSAAVGLFVVALAAPAAAQTTPALSPLEIAVACAPPPVLDPPAEGRLHILGAQDTTPRILLGNRDLLVVDAGTKDGVSVGQEFYVRRANTFGTHGAMHGRGVKTIGWVRLVAVNETTALAQVEHACGALFASDYLEPFVAPTVPAGIESADATGQPDFSSLGHVVGGNEDRAAIGAGDFALIDRGSEQGVAPGQRFAVYRDVGVNGLPLASVGELVVITAGDQASMVRITRSGDAILAGDYIARRK